MDYKAYDYLRFEVGMAYEKQDVSTPSTGVGQGWMDQWFWPIYSVDGKPLDVFDGKRNPVGQVTKVDRTVTTSVHSVAMRKRYLILRNG